MRIFEVQSIQINVPLESAVEYIADVGKLPEWTNAFKKVGNGRAVMATPAGAVEIGIAVDVSTTHGAIDWMLTFPDKSVGRAFSRVVPLDAKSVVYTFVLTAPPAPLEQLEGVLEQQSPILHEELQRLKQILEKR